jgi:hypothetical protein
MQEILNYAPSRGSHKSVRDAKLKVESPATSRALVAVSRLSPRSALTTQDSSLVPVSRLSPSLPGLQSTPAVRQIVVQALHQQQQDLFQVFTTYLHSRGLQMPTVEVRESSGTRVEEVSEGSQVSEGSPPPETRSPARTEAVPGMLMDSMHASRPPSKAQPAVTVDGLTDMVGFMQQTQAMLGNKKAEVPGDDDDESADESAGRVRKRKATTETPKAKAKAKAKARPSPPKDDSCLMFPGIKKHSPIHYGQCTIYIDPAGKCWRLKKQKGSRELQHFYFRDAKPQKVWAEVVKELKKHA